MTISIIIPTYNYARYIAEAVQSVRQQAVSEAKVELLVIDDGSTDETKSVVHGLQQVHPIIYHRQSNTGKAAATRKGIELATGDIICMLDADDWYLPGKLETTVRLFQQYPRVVHVAGPARIVWDDGSRPPVDEPVPKALLGREMKGNSLLRTFYRRNLLFGGGSTYAARASVLKQMPWQDAIDMYTDEWLLLYLLLQGNSYLMPQPMSVWRIHGKNYSGQGGEALIQKNNRLRQSSEAVLHMLQQPSFPQWLRDAYALKHAIRLENWKEMEGKKTGNDRWTFMRQFLLSGHYPLRMLWAYRAFNRVLK